ncbi:hypothetical protein MTR67_023224 [Solanum verrucosum]|uniref:Transcription factor CBF/NF-Y/archaeal histone domain-containing protein n=1 Tax=Solanum verrucosum TaxID=315347 RepID=A0AAF0R1G5_SOLVR|nr:hypothetical protein MTR67_023224 [Solanum verrucosum]
MARGPRLPKTKPTMSNNNSSLQYGIGSKCFHSLFNGDTVEFEVESSSDGRTKTWVVATHMCCQLENMNSEREAWNYLLISTREIAVNAEDSKCPIREQDRFMPIANVVRNMHKILPPHAKIADESKRVIQECVSERYRELEGGERGSLRGDPLPLKRHMGDASSGSTSHECAVVVVDKDVESPVEKRTENAMIRFLIASLMIPPIPALEFSLMKLPYEREIEDDPI